MILLGHSFLSTNTGPSPTPIPSISPSLSPSIPSSISQSPLPTGSPSSRIHPYLFFQDITKVDGYSRQDEAPYSDYLYYIRLEANQALELDFTRNIGIYNDWSSRGQYAASCAVMWYVTQDPRYNAKALSILKNMDVGDEPNHYIWAMAAGSYAIAYDLMQPYLGSDDAMVRDKLATLTDKAYQDTNSVGDDYVSFWDAHGRDYPAIGIAGLALDGYTNPNHLPLKSNVTVWKACGDVYFYESDASHTNGGRPIYSYGYTLDGTDFLGSYKDYVVGWEIAYAQAYTHYYGVSLFQVYPQAQAYFTNELWNSLPIKYGTDYSTSGCEYAQYYDCIANLVDPVNRSYVLNFYDAEQANVKKDLLPKAHWLGQVDPITAFLTRKDYSDYPRSPPPYTSRIGDDQLYQVFRSSWDANSSWMGVVTKSPQVKDSEASREYNHQDQLAFEWYSRGAILMADGGENKRWGEAQYGLTEFYHNGMSLENPWSAWPNSKYGNMPSRGVWKSGALATTAVIESGWMNATLSRTNVTQVNNDDQSPLNIASRVSWERDVLFPDGDYFLVFDRLDSNDAWGFDNIFRPSTQDTQDSTNSCKPINITLYLDGQLYDWASLEYKSPVNVGSLNVVQWDTKNVFGEEVTGHLFTVPESPVTIMKMVGRTAGYDERAEDYVPVLVFRPQAGQSLYRVTALYANYRGEAPLNASDVPVSGNGNALMILGPDFADHAYSGTGTSTFGPFTTDADTVYVKTSADPIEYTMLNGKYIDYQSSPMVAFTDPVIYFTLKNTGKNILIAMDSENANTMALRFPNKGDKYVVRIDGRDRYDWKADVDMLELQVDSGKHTIEINEI